MLSNSGNVVTVLKWPVVIVIIVALIIFSPMILGERHGQIPENIQNQQESQIGEQNIAMSSNGYNVVYSQDIVFLRLMIEAVKNNKFASIFVLMAVFLVVLAFTPFSRSIIDNWGENIRNDRKCASEDTKHARTCERDELPEKLKAEKEEKDAQRAHEAHLREKENELEKEKMKEEEAIRNEEKNENNAQRKHEKEKDEANKEHEIEKLKETNRHREKIDDNERQERRDKRQYEQNLFSRGKYIPVRILKSGCVDSSGEEFEIGSEQVVSIDVANAWIGSGLAKYQVIKGS